MPHFLEAMKACEETRAEEGATKQRSMIELQRDLAEARRDMRDAADQLLSIDINQFSRPVYIQQDIRRIAQRLEELSRGDR